MTAGRCLAAPEHSSPEADGGAWQHSAAETVASYLRGAVRLTVYGR
jgi:hypothetical protein